ncbi:MAG: hypothetical protein Q9218_007200 [Villophora microphyllina]
MELRRTRRPPRRLDDEIAEEGERSENNSPSTQPARVPSGQASQGNVTDHNPNLSPAGFPSTDPRQANSTRGARGRAARELHHNERSVLASSSPHQPTSSSFHSNRRFINEPVTGTETRVTQAFPQMDPRTASQSGRAAPHTDNDPGNPIWEANIKRIQELGNRTMEEEFIAEMETSDEDDAPASSTNRPVDYSRTRCPNWDDIALRLQIEMVEASTDEDQEALTAFIRLRLSQDQQDAITVKLYEYYDHENSEDAAIEAHQQACHDELLKGRRFGQREFQNILEKHLYKDLKGENTMVTLRDIKLARAYMIYCGLNPSVLDKYQDSDEEEEDAGVSLVVDEADMMRKFPNGVTVEEAEQRYPRLPWASPPPDHPVAEEDAAANTADQPATRTEDADVQPQEQPRRSRRPSIPPITVSSPSQSQSRSIQSPYFLKPAVNLNQSTRSVVRQTTNETIEVDVGSSRVPAARKVPALPALEQPTSKETSPQFPDEPRTPPPQRAQPSTPQPKPLPAHTAGPARSPPVIPTGFAPAAQSISAQNADSSGSEVEQPQPKRRRTYKSRKRAEKDEAAVVPSLTRSNATLGVDAQSQPTSSPFGTADLGSSMPPTPSPMTGRSAGSISRQDVEHRGGEKPEPKKKRVYKPRKKAEMGGAAVVPKMNATRGAPTQVQIASHPFGVAEPGSSKPLVPPPMMQGYGPPFHQSGMPYSAPMSNMSNPVTPAFYPSSYAANPDIVPGGANRSSSANPTLWPSPYASNSGPVNAGQDGPNSTNETLQPAANPSSIPGPIFGGQYGPSAGAAETTAKGTPKKKPGRPRKVKVAQAAFDEKESEGLAAGAATEAAPAADVAKFAKKRAREAE